jgi:hypothetical protein
MKKSSILLIFLALTLGCSASLAQEAIQESMHHYIRSTDISSPPTFNKVNGLKTVFTVYALIISIYALYWFKQKT